MRPHCYPAAAICGVSDERTRRCRCDGQFPRVRRESPRVGQCNEWRHVFTRQLNFARSQRTRTDGVHESPRNCDFVSQPRFKGIAKNSVVHAIRRCQINIEQKSGALRIAGCERRTIAPARSVRRDRELPAGDASVLVWSLRSCGTIISGRFVSPRETRRRPLPWVSPRSKASG